MLLIPLIITFILIVVFSSIWYAIISVILIIITIIILLKLLEIIFNIEFANGKDIAPSHFPNSIIMTVVQLDKKMQNMEKITNLITKNLSDIKQYKKL